jgi:hypothetical protein
VSHIKWSQAILLTLMALFDGDSLEGCQKHENLVTVTESESERARPPADFSPAKSGVEVFEFFAASCF